MVDIATTISNLWYGPAAWLLFIILSWHQLRSHLCSPSNQKTSFKNSNMGLLHIHPGRWAVYFLILVYAVFTGFIMNSLDATWVTGLVAGFFVTAFVGAAIQMNHWKGLKKFPHGKVKVFAWQPFDPTSQDAYFRRDPLKVTPHDNSDLMCSVFRLKD